LLTPDQVALLFEFILSNLPDYHTDEAKLENRADLWLMMLADIPFDFARAAVLKWAAENTRPVFPMIGEIRMIANNLMKSMYIITPEAAWIEVEQNMRKNGVYNQSTWTSPEIKQAVDAIGWRNLCYSENIGVDRAHFLRIFEGIRNQKIEQLKNEQIHNLGKKIAELQTKGGSKLLNDK
jgi:hypothetical protein